MILRSMRRVLLSLVAALPVCALASLPLQMSIAEMATEADHVLVGHVADVDMVDGNGAPVTDGQARTGPGLNNVIRIHVAVDQTLVTTSEHVPKDLLLPLDPFMHYSLGQIRSAHLIDATPRLILLKGVNFLSIKPGVLFLPLNEKDNVIRMHGAAHR